MWKSEMCIQMSSVPSIRTLQPNWSLFSKVVSLFHSLLCQAHTLQKHQSLLTKVSQSPCGFSSYLISDLMGKFGRGQDKASKLCVCMCVRRDEESQVTQSACHWSPWGETVFPPNTGLHFSFHLPLSSVINYSICFSHFVLSLLQLILSPPCFCVTLPLSFYHNSSVCFMTSLFFLMHFLPIRILSLHAALSL